MSNEPQYFYSVGAAKIPLDLVDDTIVVTLIEPIAERRIAALATGDQVLDALGLAATLLERNVLVYHPGAAARGPERLRAFAERLSRAPSVQAVTYAFRNPATGLYMIPTGDINVRFTPGATEEQIAALNALHGTTPLEQKLYAPNQYRLRLLDPSLDRALVVANAYHASPLTEWAEPDFVTEVKLGFLDRQWHLENTGQHGGLVGEDARVKPAWAAAGHTGKPEIVIAILDSGVDMADPAHPADTGHPDLQANLVVERARSFAPSGSDARPDVDPSPVTAHGTGCAGVAAGLGKKISGVAPGCRILPIKLSNVKTLPNGIVTFPVVLGQLAQAIRYAAQFAQVLSNSWFFGPSNDIDQAVKDVTATGRDGKGTVMVFATGNDNRAMAPNSQVRLPTVISVGASTNVGSRAGYSNFGDARDNAATGEKRVSVLAPSDGTSVANTQNLSGMEADGSTQGIFTSDIRGAAGSNPGQPPIPNPADDIDYTGLFGGTSSACPLVSGVCALMLSVNPNLTRAQVKYLLEATADKIATGAARTGVPTAAVPVARQAHYDPATGSDIKHGFGRVNAEQAVRAAQGKPIRQLVGTAAGVSFQDAIPVVLKRQPGTNHFVSEHELELIDARRDPEDAELKKRSQAQGFVAVRGAPGGFLRAVFQPPGGAPAQADEVDVSGQPA